MSWAGRVVIFAIALTLACLVGAGRASAVHQTGLFELDGDAYNDPAVAGDDWSSVNLGVPGGYFSHVFVPYSVEGPGSDKTYFTGGGSKDTNDISQWQWSANDVAPDKDEFTDAYAASYADAAGHTIVNFGADRFDTSGDSNVGFWFFQNQVGLNANGTFSGQHSNGDVFVVSAFTNGGAAPTISVYEWQNGSLTPITNGVTCTPGDTACAFVNASPIPVTWYYQDKSGDPVGTVPISGFFEGGIDLTSLFAGGNVPCFSNFVAETRSSQAPNAQLKDLAAGSIDSCGSITIRKSATPKSSQSFSFSASGDDPKVAAFSLVDDGSGSSNVKTFESISAGSYSFGENQLPSDWDFDHISCSTTGNGTTAVPSGSALAVTLKPGGSADCTYFNVRKPTLTVTKTVVPSSDAGTFGLQIDGQTKATGGNGTSTGAVVVTTGSHAVTEIAAGGTSLGDYTAVYGGDCDASGHVSVSAGENKVCTITNTRIPTLTVKKVLLPANDPGTFGLQIDGQTKATGGNGTSSGAVAVPLGAHSVGEVSAGGTDLSKYVATIGGDCAADGSVSLAAGENKVCTITNTRIPTLTVKKVLLPANDPGTFGLQIDGQTKATGGNGTSSGAVAVPLGAHSVGEVSAGGTDLSKYVATIGGDCAADGSVSLAAGENKVCTITNTRKPRLIVIKKVVNDDGGTAASSDFTLGVSATDATPASFNGSDSPGVEVSLAAGAYSVSETGGPSGYAASYSADCAGSIALAETKTCTVTNDDRPAKLTVIKKVVNDEGGTAVAGDFTLGVTGSQPSPASFAGSASGTAVLLKPGEYSVSESGGPAGYTGSYSADCSGSIALGESKTCTVTNDDNASTLTVIKKVVNDDGGTAVAGDFTLGVTGGQPSPASFPGAASGTTVSLKPGAYAVGETGGPAGYAGSFSADCAGSIALGESKTCTVTNDDKPAKLIVIKKVVNDDGGTAVAGDFTLGVTGGQPSPASFPGDASGTTVSLKPGAYTVGETGGPAGYAGSLSADCTGSIALGETKTCTVTNDDRPAKLTVIKKVVNDDGGTAVAGDFTLSVTGGQPSPASFKGDASGTTVSLKPGGYSVGESAGPAGYAGSFSADCTGSIALGESKTCTVTNDDRPATLTVIKKVVNDDGGTAVAGDFTLGVTGGRPAPASFAGDANGTTVSLQPGSYSVSESGGPAGYAGSFSENCTGTIALGESKTCTVTNDDKPATLTVIKKVVNDDGGTAVAAAFTLSVTGAQPSPASFPGNASGTAVSLKPGEYAVSETGGPSGYAGSFSADCSGSIALGESKTCTVTNDDRPAKLTVIKKVVNDDGGTAVAGDFTLSVTGVQPSPASFKGDANGTAVSLRPGTYAVSETAGPSGYAGSFSADCSGSIALGESKTCTVTNNDQATPPPPPAPPAPPVTPAPPAPQIDLAITKRDAPDPATVGEHLTYTLTVRNNGPDTATGVVVDDPLPATVSFVAVKTTVGTCLGGPEIRCQLGTLTSGGVVVITITVTPRQPGVIFNRATVVGNEAETNTANNTDTAQTLVKGPFVPKVVVLHGCIDIEIATRSTTVGRHSRLTIHVSELAKAAAGIRVRVHGAGVDRLSPRSDRHGVIHLTITPRKAGIIRVTTPSRAACGTPRIGVVGAFTPPVTG